MVIWGLWVNHIELWMRIMAILRGELIVQQHYIISYIGVDRPGLVDQISNIIQSVGGSWQSSRSANLAGMFSGMVHVSLEQESHKKLALGIEQLQSEALQITVHPISKLSSAPSSPIQVKAVGADRIGIVSELSSILSSLGANLEELETEVYPAPMSGEPTFSALARISIPSELDPDQIKSALEELSDDLMVELSSI